MNVVCSLLFNTFVSSPSSSVCGGICLISSGPRRNETFVGDTGSGDTGSGDAGSGDTG